MSSRLVVVGPTRQEIWRDHRMDVVSTRLVAVCLMVTERTDPAPELDPAVKLSAGRTVDGLRMVPTPEKFSSTWVLQTGSRYRWLRKVGRVQIEAALQRRWDVDVKVGQACSDAIAANRWFVSMHLTSIKL